MSIPFRSSSDEGSQAAAFLRVIRGATGGYDGTLFVMNAKGEPLEFVYSRIETPSTRLWRRNDLRRCAARELTAALFAAVTSRPLVIFAKADEVEPGFFVNEVETPVATCRVARQMASVSTNADEHGEDVDAAGLHLLWSSGSPQEDSQERALVDSLQSAGLLEEPFERAEAGLREARGEDVSGLGAVQ
jgi:hypothetical protein